MSGRVPHAHSPNGQFPGTRQTARREATIATNPTPSIFDIEEFAIGCLDLIAEQKGHTQAHGIAGVLLLHALDMQLEGEAEARRHRFIKSILRWVFEEVEYR